MTRIQITDASTTRKIPSMNIGWRATVRTNEMDAPMPSARVVADLMHKFASPISTEEPSSSKTAGKLLISFDLLWTGKKNVAQRNCHAAGVNALVPGHAPRPPGLLLFCLGLRFLAWT